MPTPLPRRIAAGCAIALLTVVAACSPAATPDVRTQSPTAPPASPAPTSSPEPAPTAPHASPSAEPAPVLTWEPVTVPESPEFGAITGAVRGGDGLVAVGYDGAIGTLLWTSADGGEWRDITPPDFASAGIATVIETSGGLLAVGRGDTSDVDAELAGAWLSSDGVSWRRVAADDEAMRGQMIDAVETQDGTLFAVGGVPGADSAGVWRSTDGGEGWERIGADIEHAFLWAIAEGGPGLVATGWRRNPEPDLAIWISADGEAWTLAPDPEGFEGFEGVDVVNHDGTLVVVGRSVAAGGARAWASTDGATWTLADLPDLGGEIGLRTVVEASFGLVTGGNVDDRAAAWVSTDAGSTWTPLADPLPEAYFASLFVTDTGELLGLGGTQEGSQETGLTGRAMIWRAVPGE